MIEYIDTAAYLENDYVETKCYEISNKVLKYVHVDNDDVNKARKYIYDTLIDKLEYLNEREIEFYDDRYEVDERGIEKSFDNSADVLFDNIECDLIEAKCDRDDNSQMSLDDAVDIIDNTRV